jgi:hypothetical protein
MNLPFLFVSPLSIQLDFSDFNEHTVIVVGLSFSGREFDDLSVEDQRDACVNGRLVDLFHSFLLLQSSNLSYLRDKNALLK